jgi:hypothetical protein
MSFTANTARPRSTASQPQSTVHYVFAGGGLGASGCMIASPQGTSLSSSNSFRFPAHDDPCAAPNAPQIGTTIRHIASLYQEAANALIDLTATLARGLVAGITLSQPPGSGQAAPSPMAPGSLGCHVISIRRADVTLDLGLPLPRNFVPTVPLLHAGDGKSQGLRDIAFVAGGAQNLSMLRIVVPDEQPPGLYTGAVVDMMTGEPGGHVALRLF